jgi:hypothetical protein
MNVTQNINDLTMLYNTENQWVYIFCSSSGILNNDKTKCFGTGSVSIFRRGKGDTYSVGCQPQAPAALCSPETVFFCFWYSFLLEDE